MREIGGYLELEKFSGEEYYPDLIALNTGRAALEYLIRAREIRKVNLPYYLCDSVSHLCERVGCEYEYYHVSKDFKPVFDKTLKPDEYLYLVNYYGQVNHATIVEYKERYDNLIVDNVQAFFQKPADGVDTIYSCRKFFGVPDGAYLSTDVRLDAPLETERSAERMKHLLGRFEGTASDYYSCFKDNDKSFREESLKYMSSLTHNILCGVDYESVSEQRKRNFSYLHTMLKAVNPLNIQVCEGPYAYPFFCQNGTEIRKQLSKKGIYIATLWPNVLDIADGLEKEYVENILPLPCDQRYGLEDMKYIVKELTEIIGDLK